MATVTSLTEEEIKRLLGGYEGVALSQDQINALAVQLAFRQEQLDATMENLNEVTVPELRTSLAESANRVSELNDVVIPNIDEALAQNQLALDNLNNVDLPALQTGFDDVVENALLRPQIFFAEEPPQNPDPEDPDPDDPRVLIVGDVWYDTDDGYKQYMWNGTEWSTFSVDIPDLSLTVKKFKTSTHMIY